MSSNSDPKPRQGDAARAWWANKTPEERSARMKELRAAQKGATAGSFKAGDPRTAAAGSKGGKASGARKSRTMKGTKRVKPSDDTKQDLQSTRGMD